MNGPWGFIRGRQDLQKLQDIMDAVLQTPHPCQGWPVVIRSPGMAFGLGFGGDGVGRVVPKR